MHGKWATDISNSSELREINYRLRYCSWSGDERMTEILM